MNDEVSPSLMRHLTKTVGEKEGMDSRKVAVTDIKHVSIPVGSTSDEIADALGDFADAYPQYRMVSTWRDRSKAAIDALVISFSAEGQR